MPIKPGKAYQMSDKCYDRSLQVMQMLSEGESVKGAASRLGLGYDSVKNLLSRFYLYIGADNLHHAMALSLRRHLIV